MTDNCKRTHCPCVLAFSIALIWGMGLMMLAWLGLYYGYGLAFVHVMSSIYIGYRATFFGGVIGFFWGFGDVFIAVLLIGWVYRVCSRLCQPGCKKHP